MKVGIVKSLLVSVFCGFFAINAFAAVSLFSDYGQIQNVQNYSTNPFWTPNAPYNQRMPQPVYVQGADLNTEDCIKVVQSLVSAQCMARDNCKNTSLSDIRPSVMVQLSNLPNNNYVSACSGYIDGVYESYVQQYGGNTINKQVAFPTGTIPNPSLNETTPQIQNPYKKQPTKWQQEIKERSQELQSLQRQNGAGSEHLSATDFPATFEDLSFSERMAVKAEGYEPFKDKKSYIIPDFKTAEEWCSGEHANSAECMDWACGEGGTDAKISKCITWRCAKSDYYAQHTQECKNDTSFRTQNEDICLPFECDIGSFANATDTCKNYLCKAPGTHSQSYTCISWLCDTDTTYKAEHEDLCTSTAAATTASLTVSSANASLLAAQSVAHQDVSQSLLCSTNKKFNLSNEKNSFKSIQVPNPETAKKIVELLIKCSSEPESIIPDVNFYKENCEPVRDDCIYICKGSGCDNPFRYQIVFDDVTDSHLQQYQHAQQVFYSLCYIANGSYKVGFWTCSNIEESQAKELDNQMREIFPSAKYQVYFDQHTNSAKLSQD